MCVWVTLVSYVGRVGDDVLADDNHDGLDATRGWEYHCREFSLNWPYVDGISDAWRADTLVWVLY